ERVLRAECLLQMGDGAALGQTLDRLHLAAVGLRGEHQAPADQLAVHAHGARAADAVLAADVRAGEPQLVPEKVHQVLPRLDLPRHRRAVDGPPDLHETFSARRLTTRVRSTGARCRRKAGEPWMSPAGARSQSRAPPAVASVSASARRPIRAASARRARTGFVSTPKNTRRASAI